jgi:hypothetical protein
VANKTKNKTKKDQLSKGFKQAFFAPAYEFCTWQYGPCKMKQSVNLMPTSPTHGTRG